MAIELLRRAVLFGATMSATLMLAACAGAPVQEMSDARQAIRAAQNAGASQKAATQLQSAQALMSSAEQSLQKRLYKAAKRDAVAARTQAMEAMQVASGHEAPQSSIPR